MWQHPSTSVHSVLFAPTLQQLHQSLNPEAGNVPIAWWLLAFGLIQMVLSQIPTMHHLRHLNAVAVAMTAVWTIMVAAECFRTGVRHSPHAQLHVIQRSRLPSSATSTSRMSASHPALMKTSTVDREPSCVVTAAGQAMREAGAHVSYAPPAGSPGAKARGAFEATGIFTFAIANMLLPEVLPSTSQMQASHRWSALYVSFGPKHDCRMMPSHCRIVYESARVMPRRSSLLSSPRRCLMAGRASTWGSHLSTSHIRSSALQDTGCSLHPSLPALLLPRASQH